jgi:rod shape-determining protein MreB
MLRAFIPTVYVQVSAQRLTLRNPKTGRTVSEVPEIAIASAPKPRIVGIGTEARSQQSASVQVINPFAHPRTLMSDFTAGEQLLKAFLRRLQGASLFAVAPRVVLHLQGDPAGGFTQVEIRAFREMALGAGACEVVVWQGRDLTDEELLSRKFPAGGQVLS